MRYPQGGGLTDERRVFREGIRQAAAERFACGEPSPVVARDLRVSVRSVQRWRKSWTTGGSRALRSTGSASPPRLSEAQFTHLQTALARGPMAQGWPDQRWTLAPGEDRDRPSFPQEPSTPKDQFVHGRSE
ncbi:helix-turn-helix domain-containing protein [Streptomyces smyrnaeus]